MYTEWKKTILIIWYSYLVGVAANKLNSFFFVSKMWSQNGTQMMMYIIINNICMTNSTVGQYNRLFWKLISLKNHKGISNSNNSVYKR